MDIPRLRKEWRSFVDPRIIHPNKNHVRWFDRKTSKTLLSPKSSRVTMQVYSNQKNSTTCNPRSAAREFTRNRCIFAHRVVGSSHQLTKLQYFPSNCLKPPSTTSTFFANKNIQCGSRIQICFYVSKQLCV